MLLSVPIGMSFLGCITVTRPVFVGCLNCLWLPTWFTSNQPSALSNLIIVRLSTCVASTLYGALSIIKVCSVCMVWLAAMRSSRWVKSPLGLHGLAPMTKPWVSGRDMVQSKGGWHPTIRRFALRLDIQAPPVWGGQGFKRSAAEWPLRASNGHITIDPRFVCKAEPSPKRFPDKTLCSRATCCARSFSSSPLWAFAYTPSGWGWGTNGPVYPTHLPPPLNSLR
jgi:hypothetical protein